MAVREHEAEVALVVQATLGEGPIWDERTGELLFVDISAGHLHRFCPDTGAHEVQALGRSLGTVVLGERGGLLLAAGDTFLLAGPSGEATAPLGDFRAPGEIVRFNDGKADPRGRAIVGTVHHEETEPVGALYLLHPDGRVEVLLEGVTISNGLAFSADGSVLYYIDTATMSVDAFRVDPDTGHLAHRRSVARLATNPDGMTIDADGMLWVALFGGGAVERIDPRSGAVLERVRLPVRQVTSVTFGGPDHADLYITTARRGLEGAALAAEPEAGNLFVARVGVTGLPAHRFAGA